MLANLSRVPILTRILAVSAFSLVLLATVVTLVVKANIEQAFLEQITGEVVSASNLLRYLAEQKGDPAIVEGKMSFGSWTANGDFSVVDLVKEKTGAEATIFQLIDGKLIRVATTVRKDDGTRGVGTELVGPAAAAFGRGESYTGINPILGHDHITRYDLLRDKNGRAIGFLFTGVPLTSLQSVTWKIVVAVLVSAAVVLVLGLGMLFFTVHHIRRAISQVAAAAQQIAQEDLPSFVQVARAMAAGDLTQRVTLRARRIEVDTKDELGAMAVDFNRMLEGLQETGRAFAEMSDSLRELVGRVRAAADNLANSSAELGSAANQTSGVVQQVAVTVQSVAKSAQEQAAAAQGTNRSALQLAQAIGEVAAGAQEQSRAARMAGDTAARMAADVEQVASNAGNVAAASQETKSSAEHGASEVSEAVASMAEIKQVVSQIAGKVENLGNLGERIDAVVATIDDIADQTNLLALNAAIEAARAGEHGRGFAVVADEVRKLAERSRRETKAIAELIRQVEEATTEAVSAAHQGSARVEEGAARAERAGVALTEITRAVDTTVDQVGGIAAAAQELAAGSRSLVETMKRISTVIEETTVAAEEMSASSTGVTEQVETIASISEENSAATEEMSASAEEMAAQMEEMAAQAAELSTMAEELQSLVAGFKLGSDAHGRQGAASAAPAPGGPIGLVPRRRASDWVHGAAKRPGGSTLSGRGDA
ncbi:MAG: methyl-accepting chemotaxis protein [Bacteroidetes bacterium]|nr:methyl-accepting chemotaxis protein [Bacteroidota bacterium]